MKRHLNIWLLVLVLVCGVSLWIGRGAPRPWHAEAPNADVLALAEKPLGATLGIQVVVLNGTHVGGLARDMGMMLGRCGLVPVGFGNAPSQSYEHCFIVNRRLADQQLTGLMDLLGGLPVLKEFDGRGPEDVVLVLGADHDQLLAGLKAKLH